VPCGRFSAQVPVHRVRFYIAAVTVQLQFLLLGQVGDELLVSVRFATAQIVIEMDDGEHNAEFSPQFEQQSQKRDRIGSPGNGDADPVAGPEEALLVDVVKDALRQLLHGSMVHPLLEPDGSG
jgi:hypothetical protein